MSSVETGQMSAVETGQMSAAETGQMSSVARTDICLVSVHNVELKSQKPQLWQCHNVQVSDRPPLIRPKWVQNGRQVVRIDPRASCGHFLASGTGLAAKNPPKYW